MTNGTPPAGGGWRGVVHRLPTPVRGLLRKLRLGWQAATMRQRSQPDQHDPVGLGAQPRRPGAAAEPRFARLLRRGGQIVRWTVTLELAGHFRRWRERRNLLPDSFAEARPPTLPRRKFRPRRVRSARPPPRAGDIRIATSEDPLVTVIIATYGQVGFTLSCLRSLAEHPPRHPIEVLLVDDAYPGPEDVAVLADIAGVRTIRNATNLGFLLSCNAAARLAKGRYIHLLNNDTELEPGAIDALADLLESRPDVGMAGSKLIYPDGSLQEAGGIVWDDASGHNFGRGDDPTAPQYNYLREVDYCSGASIMFPRRLFEELGGFDEAFAPAYYEDTDFAFRIRARGLKVLYQPASNVIHHEGKSHGTDTGAGIKAHQLVNQALMLSRWRDTLARENYPPDRHLARARDRARTRRTILIVDHYVPEPDRDAGSRSTLSIVDALLHAGWVVKFRPHNGLHSPTYTPELERRGVEVIDSRRPGNLRSWLATDGAELDHLMLMRPEVAADLLPAVVHATDAVLSYYGHDLHFARLRRQAALDPDAALLADAAGLERLERRIWRLADVVLYPSEEEAAIVRDLAPGTLARAIVGFCVERRPARQAPPAERSLLFVAGFGHMPNVDAASFLVREIVPRLQALVGPVQVTLAGSNPTEAVQALAGPGVQVTGFVPNAELDRLYRDSRVAVVPLRFGAGVKGKVVEALGQGLPLVTTPTGAQGIAGLEAIVPVQAEVGGIVAALAVLLTDDAAWMAQSAAQAEFAARVFSLRAVQASVVGALEAAEVAIGRGRLAGRPAG